MNVFLLFAVPSVLFLLLLAWACLRVSKQNESGDL